MVDYETDLSSAVRGLAPFDLDAVIHLAGDGAQLADMLRPGGRLVSRVGFSAESAAAGQISATAMMTNPDPETLNRLGQLVASGRLQVPIQAVYPLEEAAQALSDFTKGKLAIDVR